VGRRTLILLGSIGTALALARVAFIMASGAARSWLLPLLVLFIASFAISQGAGTWVYLREIFPTGVRAHAVRALGSATGWILNAGLGDIAYDRRAFQRRSIRIFAGMMALQFVAALLFMSETRGVVLETLYGVVSIPLPDAAQRNM